MIGRFPAGVMKRTATLPSVGERLSPWRLERSPRDQVVDHVNDISPVNAAGTGSGRLDPYIDRRRRWAIGVLAAGTACGLGVVSVIAGGVASADDAQRRGVAVEATADGWAGVDRIPVTIPMDRRWTAKGELTRPAGRPGRLPAVVLFHGSGLNDRDQNLPGPGGTKVSTFRPLAQALSRAGYAVLRYDKRGVVDVGPVLSQDTTLTQPAKPYRTYVADARKAVRFAADHPGVDRKRIYLLGHSEGTLTASLIAASPGGAGVKPAGVIAMGVVGYRVSEILEYQLAGREAQRLHVQFDVDGDGQLTAREAREGFFGQPQGYVKSMRPLLLSKNRVAPSTDTNKDGRIAIDAEFGTLARKVTGVTKFPNIPAAAPAERRYFADIQRFGHVAAVLPRYDGPSFLLNGENDIQTVPRGAYRADAALAAARRDHTLKIYPGLGHGMNRTSGFDQHFGEPDQEVIADVVRWLDQMSS